MILPRLTPHAVVETARLLSPFEVPPEDPRLAGIDQMLVRCLVLSALLIDEPKVSLTYFVEWPDMSLGVAHLWPDEPRRSDGLLEAYVFARDALEALALDCFRLYDTSKPH